MALSPVNASVIAHPPVTVASAATCNIGAVLSDRVLISGTTGITSFGPTPNAIRFVTFLGALTLTHNATTLNLIGGANVITVAGESGVFASDGLGNWRCLQYASVAGSVPTIAEIAGLQAALDAKLPSATYTAADVLTKIKTVDGSGSGLDADTLDGNNATAFVKTVNGIAPDGSGAVTISVASGTQDVRLGASVTLNFGATITAPPGHAITSVTDASSYDTNVLTNNLVGLARPIQKFVSGSWITVSQL